MSQKIKRVLFVCTGNSCRSVMAEGLFRKMAADAGLDVAAASAGVSAFPGMAATDETIAVLAEEGIDARGHRSRRATPELIRESDLIIAMQPLHRDHLIVHEASAAEKTMLLTDLMPADKRPGQAGGIPDPIGMGRKYYQNIKKLILEGIGPLIEHVKEKNAS